MTGSYRKSRATWRRSGAPMRREVTRNHRWRCATSGKWAYVNRKDARRAAKIAHPDEPLAAYLCPDAPHWHVGHLNPYARDNDRRSA